MSVVDEILLSFLRNVKSLKHFIERKWPLKFLIFVIFKLPKNSETYYLKNWQGL